MSTSTGEQRVAKLFGLTGDNWMRHANPTSVWTRFAVLPMIVVSVWSRDWIGWWCLVPVVLSLVFMMVNPLLFPPPRSTRNWASKGVLGERVWSERNDVEVPPQFLRSGPLTVTYVFQLFGVAALVYGLVRFDVVAVVTGVLLTQAAKAWFIDRMVLLFDDMKGRHQRYAEWDF